jgi:hypothetical protein
MYKKILGMVIIVVLSWSVFMLLPDREAQDKPSNPVYEQVIEKLENLLPGETIEAQIGTEKEEYKVDEPFEIRFQTSKDCYVVLMNIAAGEQDPESGEVKYGEISFLLPYSNALDNKIEGGRVYSTSHDFGLDLKATPPYGYGTINIFCSPEKIELFESDFGQEQMFYTIKPDDEDRLRMLLTRLDQLQQSEWSGSSVSFLIKKDQGKLQEWLGGNISSLFKGRQKTSSKFGALPAVGSTGTTEKFFPPIGATGSTGKK